MTISLGNAIKSVKEDEHWIKKVLIGGLITTIVAVAAGAMESETISVMPRAISIITYFLFGSFLSGFLVSTGNKIFNSDSNSMTEWTEPNLLIKGLKFIFSVLLYCIVMTILFMLVTVVIAVIIGIILGIIYALIVSLLHIDVQSITPLFVIICCAFGLVFGLYYMQFVNAAYTSYYKTLSFKNLMAFKKHFCMIKENQHATWTLIGKEILYILLFLLAIIIATITIVGIIAIPFISFAAYITLINLKVQYGKEIEIGKYFE